MTARMQSLIRTFVFGALFYLGLQVALARQRAHDRRAEAYYRMMHDSLEAMTRR
jgi:hypothetical protein